VAKRAEQPARLESGAGEGRPQRSLTEQLASTARVLAKTVALVARVAPRGAAAMSVATLAGALLPVAIALTAKAIVDAVVAHDRAAAVRWVAIECGLVTAQVVAARVLAALQQVLGERLRIAITSKVLEKAAAVPMSRFEDGEFYDRLTRVREESTFRPISAVVETFRLLQAGITLCAYLAVLLPYSWVLSLVLLGAALPAAFVDVWFSRSRFLMRYWQSPEGRKLNYLGHVMTQEASVKEVKLLGLSDLLIARFRATSDVMYRDSAALARRQTAWAISFSAGSSAVFYACYLAVVLAAVVGRITLGAMTLYVMAFRQSQQAFESLLGAFGAVYENTLYMSNFFEYLALPEGPVEADRPRLLPAARSERGIRFDQVGFRYARRDPEGFGAEDPWALRGLSFFVPEGQSVALVGPNGAGKTTLVKLLLGLYPPSEGVILLDGRDLDDWDRAALQARYGVVFQDFAGFEFDIRDNVGFGSVAHLEREERIRRAVSLGDLDSFVTRLPDGLATKLGKWAHDGIQVSRGQWQQIALARAFMREEADILVLDEPTASLDAHAEARMFERFRALSRGRTSFIISHRLSALHEVDRILVLDRGRLVEDGPHAALIAAGEIYARMYQRQSAGYDLERGAS